MRTAIPSLILCITLFLTSSTEPLFAAKPIRNSTEKPVKVKKDALPQKNKLAKWSLILSGSGFASLVIPSLSVLSPYLIMGGLVCGIIALSQIRKTKERGKGLAIASLVLGGVFLVVVVIAIAVLLSLFK